MKELNEAKVLAVGPGGLDKEGKRITPSVAPGDKVLIPQVQNVPLQLRCDQTVGEGPVDDGTLVWREPREGWRGGILAVQRP